MRAFDWRTLLAQHRVPFIEKGPNVKANEINIRCPWCGAADPSFHMGIAVGTTGWYSCWRNRSQHSGKSPLRLIMKLLNVPYWKAREIAGLGDEYVDPEGFDAVMARLLGKDDLKTKIVKREFIEFNKYFRTITDAPSTRRAWNYLFTRGFDFDDIDQVVTDYDLQTARDGDYANRVILPYYLDGNLVTWTARSIGPARIRYMDLPVADSIVPAKETLYNHDCIPVGGKLLVLVEGPIDTIKLDFYGKADGIRAVGCSTNSLTDHQTYMLEQAATNFDWIGVMMDNKTGTGIVDSMRMKQSLAFLPKVKTLAVPAGRGDTGEALPRELKDWACKITKELP